jgi:hypothetical protein
MCHVVVFLCHVAATSLPHGYATRLSGAIDLAHGTGVTFSVYLTLCRELGIRLAAKLTVQADSRDR